jgi:sugar phosphate isomerase/epimerase
MDHSTRRRFLKQSLGISAAIAAGPLAAKFAWGADSPQAEIAFGLVTYQWGKDWDVPTLIKNCQTAKVSGVELRTTHAHGVEPNLTAPQRVEVKRQFQDSPIALVGLGTNECYHHADPKTLAKSIEATKAFIKLSHDVGGSGVKVKPNDLPKNVAQEKTIEQIGKALNEVAAFGADYGQELRLEVHGGCSLLPIMKQIMDVANHPNARVCWNSNATDLKGEGLEHNFNLVKNRFGHTAHVRELTSPGYPWQQLFTLFVRARYSGWLLLEAGSNPPDRLAALIQQRETFTRLLAAAKAS